jgi:hypothetical protein
MTKLAMVTKTPACWNDARRSALETPDTKAAASKVKAGIDEKND